MSIIEYGVSKNCLKNIIQKHLKSDIIVHSVDTSNALAAGENFLSELLRIVVKYSVNKCEDVHLQSFIAKIPVDSQYVLELEEQIGFFNCEMTFYNNIFPFLEKLEYEIKVCPTPFYLSIKPTKIIILEDLSVMNYQTGNCQEGLNLEHCLFVIEKLAYFHAASLKIYEMNPSVMEKFCKGSMCKNLAVEVLIRVTFQEMLKTCQKHSSLQKYFEKMPKDFPEKFYLSAKPDPKLNVLNHGDFWCNNIMFKYNQDGQLQNALFIDFQLAVFTSPVFDLHCFIASTPTLEVLKNHINTIITRYYHCFCTYASTLKIKTRVPNRDEFDAVFRDKAFAGFAILSTLTPLFKANKRKDASVTEFIQNDEEGGYRHDCINNPYYLNVVKCLLPYYESLGLFNP